MALPKIAVPQVDILIPSLGKKVPFRAYLVAEEKILLMAQQSGLDSDILESILLVAQACCMDDSIKFETLCDFDIEYVFLKLRGFSVDNRVRVVYTEKGVTTDISFMTDDVEMEMPKDLDPIVFVDKDKTQGIRLKWPTARETIAFSNSGLSQDEKLSLILDACIDEVFTDKDMFKFSDETFEERLKYIDSLSVPVLNKIQQFFDAMPELSHTITYTHVS